MVVPEAAALTCGGHIRFAKWTCRITGPLVGFSDTWQRVIDTGAMDIALDTPAQERTQT